MNEVTRIHLGRQPFTISVEAHEELKNYLAAIKKQVGEQDVLDEVEMRMAELLGERGIGNDKVVLATDVNFLKDQLGDPKDFKEDTETPHTAPLTDQGQKRLFRDTDHAMIAGVASGLANYFGVDVLLIRILFVVGTIAWGGSILLYIALWLLVPEARTSSEKLQMQGKPVTVEGLKEIVERADIKGAATRANSTVTPVINGVFKTILKIIGIGFILAGLAAIFGLIATKVYMSLHNGQLFQEGLFPVGGSEHLLANLGLILAGLVALFVILMGLAMARRRWPIRAWITGVLVGIFFIGLAGAIALSADAAPKVRDRYLSRSHTVTRSVPPFQDVTIQGKDVDYQWQYADSYSVSFHYFDNPDISKIKTTVSNNLLTIDTTNYQRDRNCEMLCLFRAYNLLITVKGPAPNFPIRPVMHGTVQVYPDSQHGFQ